MSRFAFLSVLILAGMAMTQPALAIFPPREVAAANSFTFNTSIAVAPEWKLLAHSTVQQEVALTGPQKANFALLSDPLTVFEAVNLATLGYIPPIATRERLPAAR